MTPRQRLKIQRENAAKARAALARKRAQTGGTEVLDIPLDLVPARAPAARTPARRASGQTVDPQEFAELVVACYLALKRRVK